MAGVKVEAHKKLLSVGRVIEIEGETQKDFICWFTSKMATTAGAGPGLSQEQGARRLFQVSYLGLRPKCLGPLPLLFLDTLEGS